MWCDDPQEDPVISVFAGCLANHDRAHSRGHKLLECESDHSQFRSLPSFASSSIEVGDPDNDNSGLCARSWLARHPAKIEITGSCGGSSHHTKFFFFFCKNHDFSRFLINFSTVGVVKHTHVVDPKRLTHIHSHRDLNSLSLSTESTYLLVPMP